MPYSKPLEDIAYPHEPQVVAAVLATVGREIGATDPMTEIVMPRLSDTMEEGTILRWLKADGEEVARGEELVEIETDKATMVYESDQAGTLKLVAGEGDTLPVGATIARVGDPAEGEGEGGRPWPGRRPWAMSRLRLRRRRQEQRRAARERTPRRRTATARERSRRRRATARPRAPARRVKASPLARRIASERGVDLAALTGTGPGGRIVKADVEGAGPTAPVTAPGAAPPRRWRPRRARPPRSS